jgi:hypothetical protein
MSSIEGGPMSGARGGGVHRRLVVWGALAFALSFSLVATARAAKFDVAQCGWHLGTDASWADTTGGAKFRSDSYCATPAGADPFDGAHMKSFTRAGEATVSGTRFARWRWDAPVGTAITRVSGTWWHALHDGIEQRVGAVRGGGFDVFAAAAATDTAPREFVAGFSPGATAIEDRLLCARAESNSCSLAAQSFSSVRALTITVEDGYAPSAGVGGELVAPAWHRGQQSLQVASGDTGSGIRFGETLIDGARVALTEYPCAKAMIGGQWRATRMTPCAGEARTTQSIGTSALSDGPHLLVHCAVDFAGNTGCTPPGGIFVDNNPPAHPRALAVKGGGGWRRTPGFELGWENPDQGSASPIAGAAWRLKGPGLDSGDRFSAGRGLKSLAGLSVPSAGAYSASVWLRDEAGNEAPGSAVSVPLLFDDIAPGVAFAADSGDPGLIRADVSDLHSGPAGGEIHLRRLGGEGVWTELPAKFQAGTAGMASLLARLPDSLAPGTYVFRADASDGAGNTASTTLRVDGSEMTLRVAPEPARPRIGVGGAKTRIFARLRWRQRRGSSVTVPFGARAVLSGRLLDAEGAGLAGRRLKVAIRPSRGALSNGRALYLETGSHGGFRLELPAGTSRRIAIVFPGDRALDRARRAPLSLRVRGGVVFHATPSSLATGERLVLWGRVRAQGAPLPRRGKLVAVQYLEEETGAWRPVLVTRSDHSGHFRARYRFRYVSDHARIRLRAVALAEERWPYVPGASRSRTVTVHG